jgi:hypothetical protein
MSVPGIGYVDPDMPMSRAFSSLGYWPCSWKRPQESSELGLERELARTAERSRTMNHHRVKLTEPLAPDYYGFVSRRPESADLCGSALVDTIALKAWPGEAILQAVLAQIPWYHNRAILESLPYPRTLTCIGRVLCRTTAPKQDLRRIAPLRGSRPGQARAPTPH